MFRYCKAPTTLRQSIGSSCVADFEVGVTTGEGVASGLHCAIFRRFKMEAM